MFKFIKKFISYKQPETIHVDDEEEITDEIERSLWEIKQTFDFDTEEISNVVNDYKQNKHTSKHK